MFARFLFVCKLGVFFLEFVVKLKSWSSIQGTYRWPLEKNDVNHPTTYFILLNSRLLWTMRQVATKKWEIRQWANSISATEPTWKRRLLLFQSNKLFHRYIHYPCKRKRLKFKSKCWIRLTNISICFNQIKYVYNCKRTKWRVFNFVEDRWQTDRVEYAWQAFLGAFVWTALTSWCFGRPIVSKYVPRILSVVWMPPRLLELCV